MVSSPAPALMTSSPAYPRMVSFWSVPVNVSASAVPVSAWIITVTVRVEVSVPSFAVIVKLSSPLLLPEPVYVNVPSLLSTTVPFEGVPNVNDTASFSKSVAENVIADDARPSTVLILKVVSIIGASLTGVIVIFTVSEADDVPSLAVIVKLSDPFAFVSGV